MTGARQWLPLDPGDFDSDAEQKINGVLFHVSISPYDIPRAVRGWYDEDKKRFIIEFRYFAVEGTREQKIDDHVLIHLGEHSGRLCAIEADVQAMEVKAVLLCIDHLIGEAEATESNRIRPNYEVARKIITDKAPQLWQSARTAASQVHAAH